LPTIASSRATRPAGAGRAGFRDFADFEVVARLRVSDPRFFAAIVLFLLLAVKFFPPPRSAAEPLMPSRSDAELSPIFRLNQRVV
jgi:hypothetical protein